MLAVHTISCPLAAEMRNSLLNAFCHALHRWGRGRSCSPAQRTRRRRPGNVLSRWRPLHRRAAADLKPFGRARQLSCAQHLDQQSISGVCPRLSLKILEPVVSINKTANLKSEWRRKSQLRPRRSRKRYYSPGGRPSVEGAVLHPLLARLRRLCRGFTTTSPSVRRLHRESHSARDSRTRHDFPPRPLCECDIQAVLPASVNSRFFSRPHYRALGRPGWKSFLAKDPPISSWLYPTF